MDEILFWIDSMPLDTFVCLMKLSSQPILTSDQSINVMLEAMGESLILQKGREIQIFGI